MLDDALLRAFETRGTKEQIAVRSRKDDRTVFSGVQLAGQSEAVARILKDWLGSAPHVLVLALPAGMGFITTFLGAVLAGVTVVPAPVPRQGSNSDRFRHIVADCEATAVLCLPEHVGKIRSTLSEESTECCPVVAVPLDTANLPDPRIAIAATGPVPLVIQYTSGSTRAPKGVRLMGENIVENFKLVQRAWGLNERSRFVNWLPHFHDMGLIGGILYPLLSGGFSAQLSPLDFIRKPALWPEAVSSERASFSGGAAFGFAECIRRVSAEAVSRMDLSCWTGAFCGAEPVPAGLLNDFHAHFKAAGLRRDALFACYGLAEMTLFAAGAPSPARAGELVEPCRLNPELARGIAIVDTDNGARVPNGCEGEIWLTGASQAAGYHDLPEETAATFDQSLDGERCWLRTGDIGVKTETDLFITGRIKDVIICNGRKIAAPEIEWVAARMHQSLNPMAIAVFMADPNNSGCATLIAETHLGQIVDADEGDVRNKICQAVRGEWGIELEDVLFVPRGRLERTSSGKVRRAAVAEAWRDGAYGSCETGTEEQV